MTYEPTLLEIYNARPDVQADFERRFPGQNPTAQGTEANRALNDWYNETGKAEGADMASKGLFETPSDTQDIPRDIPSDTQDTQITVWKDGKSTIVHQSELQDYLNRGYSEQTSDASDASSVQDDSSAYDELLGQMQEHLDELTKRGQTINPYVEITPEMAAEFMAQAEREIDPYYQSQMALAKEGLLTSLGYSRDDLMDFEGRMEKKYGKQLKAHGEESAEAGFARSGKRMVGEREMAEETQENIDYARQTASRTAADKARSYAQLWGGADLPQTNISGAPRVIAGQAGFEGGTGSSAMYSLDDSIYDDLIGSREWERQAQVKTRKSELEGGHRTRELEKRQRELNL